MTEDDGNNDTLDRSTRKRILIQGGAARVGRGDMPGYADSSMVGNLLRIAGGNEQPSGPLPRHSLTLRIELRQLNPQSPDQAITIKAAESLIGGHFFSAKLRAADAEHTTAERCTAKTIVADAMPAGENVKGMMHTIHRWLEKNIPNEEQRTGVESNIAKYLLVVLQQNELHKGDHRIKQGPLKEIVASIDALSPTQRKI